ncbi:galactokinase [Melioribacteraceae bacterium 4301-Me]|uniref:galactokinase n=1 Tax=Pyranulibacter aquaticus TaxID=3163344 RepID=UPI00359BA617
MGVNNFTDVLEIIKELKQQTNSLRDFYVVKSPIGLIFLGDHTHYNDGILISAAVDKYTWVAIRKRTDDKINLYRKDTNKVLSFTLSQIENLTHETGFKMAIGLIKLLKDEKLLTSGFDCIIDFSTPQWLGLGVLAAQQMATIIGMKKIFGINYPIDNLINLVKRNENNLIGKISNTALHNTSVFAKNDKLILTDLRYKQHKNIPFNGKDYKIVICNTNVQIEHVEKICNERIEECEVGVKGLRLYIWGIKNLRDVQLDFLMRHIHMLPRKIFSRVLYNVNERIRAENALKLLKKNNYEEFGALINQSHNGLSIDYEISDPKVDFIVAQAMNLKGVIGSKMISCSPIRSTFHLVESAYVENFVDKIKKTYYNQYNNELDVHILNISKGIEIIPSKKLNYSY